MLQLFRKYKGILLDKIEDHWQERFKFGISIMLGVLNIHRYVNGHYRFQAGFLHFMSTNTGHWPFCIFDFVYLTGDRGCFHITLFGMMVGSMWVSDVKFNEDGSSAELLGPDYKKRYTMFSCINHQHKPLEEIVK